MIIEPFRSADIAGFLELAAAEGWVAEPWEFEFLLTNFPGGCFTARSVTGEAAGFVTSLRHDRSGWIGNLIVAQQFRSAGIGGTLFRKVLEKLSDSGVETIWLTASESGLPLYQKCGFNRIDTIIRWSGSGRQGSSGYEAKAVCETVHPLLNDIDSRAWGDRRAALVAVTAARGKVLRHRSGFAVVQPAGDAMQLGPFLAPGYGTADFLLNAALNTIPPGTKVYMDAPASNRNAMLLFNRNRMRITGSTELMYTGVKPAYRPELLYGLATMGGCG